MLRHSKPVFVTVYISCDASHPCLERRRGTSGAAPLLQVHRYFAWQCHPGATAPSSVKSGLRTTLFRRGISDISHHAGTPRRLLQAEVDHADASTPSWAAVAVVVSFCTAQTVPRHKRSREQDVGDHSPLSLLQSLDSASEQRSLLGRADDMLADLRRANGCPTQIHVPLVACTASNQLEAHEQR